MPHVFLVLLLVLLAGLRLVAVANLLLSPFLLMFLLAYFFMRNAERLYHHPAALGSRRWSGLAKWRIRELNELPHYLHHRWAARGGKRGCPRGPGGQGPVVGKAHPTVGWRAVRRRERALPRDNSLTGGRAGCGGYGTCAFTLPCTVRRESPRRLSASHPAALRSVAQFPSHTLAALARFIVFVT